MRVSRPGVSNTFELTGREFDEESVHTLPTTCDMMGWIYRRIGADLLVTLR